MKTVEERLEIIETKLGLKPLSESPLDWSKLRGGQDISYGPAILESNGVSLITGRYGFYDRLFVSSFIGGRSVTWELILLPIGGYELVPRFSEEKEKGD